jgi:hypothetical protein
LQPLPPPPHRYLPTQANGQAANAANCWNAQKGSYVAPALEVLALEGTLAKDHSFHDARDPP